MLLKPAPVSVRQLSYSAGTCHFTGEISDTHGFGRVYDDACDEGLTLIGVTGREIVFVVWADHHNDEGELTHWDLRAVGTAPYTMTLFND